jgi:hypothetical protein
MVHIGSGALLLLFIPAPLIVTTPHHSALFHRHPQSFKLPLPSHSIRLLSLSQPPRHRHHRSTCNPPHEQLLVGLEVGGALSSVVCHSFVVVCCCSVVIICCRLFVVICCHLFIVICRCSFVIIHCLSYVIRCRRHLSLFVHRCLLSVIRHSFVIICHRRLVSIIPTYPPCEQWLTVAGVGADM